MHGFPDLAMILGKQKVCRCKMNGNVVSGGWLEAGVLEFNGGPRPFKATFPFSALSHPSFSIEPTATATAGWIDETSGVYEFALFLIMGIGGQPSRILVYSYSFIVFPF